MDFDEPLTPSPQKWAAYIRYKRWQDRFRPDSRPQVSGRAYRRYVERPLSIAGLGCMWWSKGFGAPTRPRGDEIFLLGIALLLFPALVEKAFRVRRAPDA